MAILERGNENWTALERLIDTTDTLSVLRAIAMINRDRLPHAQDVFTRRQANVTCSIVEQAANDLNEALTFEPTGEAPMTKTKTITLIPGFYKEGEPRNGPLGYRVARVTDSLELTPGDIISRKQADELCAAKDWKVTISNQ